MGLQLNAAMETLRYSHAFTLTIEALHTLCCGYGSAKERLSTIDPEFYSLRVESFPPVEDIQKNFAKLNEFVTRFDASAPGDPETSASLESTHDSELSQALQLIWDIHQGFSSYMNREEL